ncbi:MAG TPA: SdrD B-like domain-containing protein [Pseudonocardiaceae bacterium]
MSFDQAAYQSSATITLTVKVTDLGTSPRTQVQVLAGAGSTFGRLNGDIALLGGYDASITPGATVTATETGYATDPSSDAVVFNAQTEENDNSASLGTPQTSISATVTPVVGSYGGVIFGDLNGNGVQDSGEPAVAGADVTLTGPFSGLAGQDGPQNYETTTDTNGHFLLSNLPGGNYTVLITPPQTWKVTYSESVTVDGSAGQTSLAFPATATFAQSLHATVSFDRPSYHVGQQAGLTVTLTDVTKNPISNIQGFCDPPGFPGNVLGIGKGWDIFSGAGVTLAPGQRKVFHLSEAVTADSLAGGTFYADCIFGPNAQTSDSSGYPQASATAKVLPSLKPTIDFSVQFVNDGAGGAPQFLDSLLVEAGNGDPIVFYAYQTTTQYTGIPQGRYDLTGLNSNSWQFAPGQSPLIDTSTLTPGQVVQVHLVPSSS